MKAKFIGAVMLCALLSLTHGSEYQFSYKDKSTCIDVKMDVKFTLTDGNTTIKFDGTNFTVKSGDCASADETVASLTLSNANEDFLAMSFMYDAQKNVLMGMMFSFGPYEYFPGIPVANTISLVDNGDMNLGGTNQLFRCASPQRMTLTGKLENTNYTMYMDMSNTQIQAFNIKDGNLSSDVFVCSADKMTTSAQSTASEATTNSSSNGTTEVTTQPLTTSSSNSSNGTTEVTTQPLTTSPSNGTNFTSEAPTTVSTAPPPTTAPPPPFPAKSTYIVKEGNKTCIILEGGFQLEVKHNNDTKYIDVPQSQDVSVSGMCASGDGKNASLTISPKPGDNLVFLTMEFEINAENKSQLVSWNAEVKFDKTSFNFTANSSQTLAGASMYYKCEKNGSFSDKNIAINYKDLKVQAFNLEDGTFSENGMDCEGDVGPIPPSGNIPDNHYSVKSEDNKTTCIVFKGQIELDIPYKDKLGNPQQEIGLPGKFTTSGTCNISLNGYYSQQLTIHFYNNWNLTFSFSSDVKQGKQLTAGKPNKYQISQIDLQYELNSNLFPTADDSVVGTRGEFISFSNLTQLQTDAGKSYMCNKGATFGIEDKANNNTLTIQIKNFRYQAFKEGPSEDFGDPNECSADEETNSIVPIAVGAALAGLVIIVLIAYLIGRKRSRKGYEQV